MAVSDDKLAGTMLRTLLIVSLFLLATGCAHQSNPSFDVSTHQARVILDRLAEDPRPLDRPLVVVGGFADPGIGAGLVHAALASRIRDERVLDVVTAFGCDFDDCRQQLIEQVQRRFGNQQVDVIGMSMGGLVARYAAAPLPGRPGLNVARLFTISAPHRGAILASLPTLDQKMIEMRPGSALLDCIALYDAHADYELIPYARLGDFTVGAKYSAPPGITPWWISTPFFQDPHDGANFDPRILADIVLRLRNEPPLTHDPRAPLPSCG